MKAYPPVDAGTIIRKGYSMKKVLDDAANDLSIII
jgi:hypothetical protein